MNLFVTPAELETWTIQPAFSYESSPSGGYAWFVAKGPAAGTDGGQIYYRRLQWSGSTPQWVGSWTAITDPIPSYRKYYDIPQSSGFSVPQSGGTVNIGFTASRLMTAVIRSGYLWTCHHIGFAGTNLNYTGGNPDRAGVQWFKLQVGTTSLTYNTHGRIYDNAESNPYSFYFPSLNVDPSGNTLFGFSGVKAAENVASFFTGRKQNGAIISRPVLVQAGRSARSADRWGDYSATSIDPNDGSFWTVQEYAHFDPDQPTDKPWGTWIMQIKVQ